LTGTGFVKQRDRLGLRLVVALVAGTIAVSDGSVAQAFDFFGLFGSDDTPPAVSRTAIPYSFTVEVAGGAPPDRAVEALNAALPDDVAVVAVEAAHEGFHARFDARSRSYRYRLFQRREPSPFAAPTCTVPREATRCLPAA